MLFNPPADTPIGGGDVLIVMGKPDNLRTLESYSRKPALTISGGAGRTQAI